MSLENRLFTFLYIDIAVLSVTAPYLLFGSAARDQAHLVDFVHSVGVYCAVCFAGASMIIISSFFYIPWGYSFRVTYTFVLTLSAAISGFVSVTIGMIWLTEMYTYWYTYIVGIITILLLCGIISYRYRHILGHPDDIHRRDPKDPDLIVGLLRRALNEAVDLGARNPGVGPGAPNPAVDPAAPNPAVDPAAPNPVDFAVDPASRNPTAQNPAADRNPAV